MPEGLHGSSGGNPRVGGVHDQRMVVAMIFVIPAVGYGNVSETSASSTTSSKARVANFRPVSS